MNLSPEYLILASVLCGLKVTYDGFKCRKWHRASEWFGVGLLIVIGVFPFLWMTDVVTPPKAWTLSHPENLWRLFVGVALFWFGCFDTLVNWAMGQKWYYIGMTKDYDKTIRKFLNKTKVSIDFFRFIQLCCFIIGSLMLLWADTDALLRFN